MRKISVVAALLFVMPSQASAANWLQVGTSVDESGAVDLTVYIDTSTIKSNGSIRRYWQRMVFVNHPERWMESKALYESNCATDQRRMLQVAVYKVDESSPRSYSRVEPWKYIIPETVEEGSHNFVCAFRAHEG